MGSDSRKHETDHTDGLPSKGRRTDRSLAVDETLISELSLQSPPRISVRASLSEAARQLRDANVSSALVGEHPYAFLSERDLTGALADGRLPDEPVTNVTSRPMVWITTTTRLGDAAEMMLRHEVRHLVVIAPTGELVGVLSMREAFGLLLQAARGHRATGCSD